MSQPDEVLDAAIQAFVRHTYGPGLLASWVLITAAVPVDDEAPGRMVMNYGGPDAQSWITTSGLLRWATLHHEGPAQ